MVDETARRVKKLVSQNRFSMDEISRLAGVPILDIPRLYKSYTGTNIPDTFYVVGRDEEINLVKAAIVDSKPVILHGPPGTGKSLTAKKAALDMRKSVYEVNVSMNRTADLLAQELFGCHKIKSDTVYILEEIDNFHWKSHAYFLSVLKDAAVSIIMTCNNIENVGKETLNHVKKNGVMVKVAPPTLADLEKLISEKFPRFKGRASELYDQDFREVFRRMEFDVSKTRETVKDVRAVDVAGNIFGNANYPSRLSAISACSDPLSWVIPWLDQNLDRMAKWDVEMKMLDELSIVDSWMRKTKKKYVEAMLASLPCPRRRGKLDFPALLFSAEKKAEKKVEEEELVTEVTLKEKVTTSTAADPFGEF